MAGIGVSLEALTTVAQNPMEEISRVAKLHACESLLLGFSDLDKPAQQPAVEKLMTTLDADIVVLRAKQGWQPAQVERILVPVAGVSGHEHLRARLLGSLLRTGQRQVTFLRVLSVAATQDEVRRVRAELRELAEIELRGSGEIEVVLSGDPAAAIAQRANDFELVVMGTQRMGRRKKIFGDVIPQIARQTDCPLVVISRRG